MKIRIATLFPEMFDALNASIIGRAIDKGLLDVGVFNIRDFSQDKHKKCDDYPFGGGAGMVMTPQPLHSTINHIDPCREYVRIYMSPKGEKLSQKLVEELSKQDKLLFICGNYEGVDQRFIDLDVDREISIGDYVLTGGELPAMVAINAIARYVDGVLGSEQSTKEESFADDLLEYPQYTRPQVFEGLEVPQVLLSGNHAEIARWRRQKQLEITKDRRPDLLKGE
ncbi:MAG: tRNA (guanosine(37)-N1)-methyltransferase TrmD [Christensenellales bacterium]